MATFSYFLASHNCQICRDHLLHQVVKARFVPPAESLACFGRVAEQKIDLSRTKIPRVDLNQHLA
jgi:hypothetical protein